MSSTFYETIGDCVVKHDRGTDNEFRKADPGAAGHIQDLLERGLKLALESDRNRENHEALAEIARELVKTYNVGILGGEDTRFWGTRATAELAEHSWVALEVVIADARSYARGQHTEDAFPFSPNSFDVLGLVGCDKEAVLAFLEETVRSDYGAPRWAAIEVLCQAEHPSGDRILRKVLSGEYRPVKLDLSRDIDLIASKRGAEFLEDGGD